MRNISYNNRTIEGFLISSLFWGVCGILLGIFISIQMWNPELNYGKYFTYGRLRDIHATLLSHGFMLGATFGLFYYMITRLTKIDLIFPRIARLHLWLFNLFMLYFIVERQADIRIIILWIVFAVNIFAMITNRLERQMYIALWFVLATVVGAPIMYIFGDVWAFLLVIPVLGMFYFFLPAATRLPIHSRLLAAISFWGLILAFAVYNPLYAPVVAVFLIIPVWGAVINGYFTIESDWSKLHTNYLTKFFLAGITIFGLQTIQGAAQALPTVHSFIRFTDWNAGYLHFGAMGWAALIIFACMYHVVPKLYNGTQIYSIKLANVHFWFTFFGLLVFVVSAWTAGVAQGAMLKMTDAEGTLVYSYIDTLEKVYPFFYAKTAAGAVYIAGVAFFLINIVMTIRNGRHSGGAA